MQYLDVSCNWCGSDQYTVIFKGPDLLMDMPGTFQFVECDDCGLLRQNPRLAWDDLLQYYQDGYAAHSPQITDIPSDLGKLDKRYGLWKRVRFVNKYKPGGRWLDIGCGTGRVLQEAQTWEKWELFGLEPVAKIAAYTENKLNIPVYPYPLDDYSGDQEQFDIITMWDVLEHLPSPHEGINKVADLLKKDGVLIFSIPNLNSLGRKIFKEYWIGYDLPRHLYLFPDELLVKMLSQAGLKILKTKCVAGSHGAFFLSLAFYNQKADSKILNWILKKGENYWLFRAFTLIPFWIIDKLKMSTNITYVAKKL